MTDTRNRTVKAVKGLYTKQEAAEWLGTSVDELTRLHKEGRIAYTRLRPGGHPKVSIDELESFKASLETF